MNKILAAKKQKQNTAALVEQQIDQMVYALYGLSEDEIKIVEAGK